MANPMKVFSLEGKGLKLDTAADLEPHIKALREMSDVEEVRFLGNTLGVEACKALGEVLETKKSLQASIFSNMQPETCNRTLLTCLFRLQTWQISLLAVYSM